MSKQYKSLSAREAQAAKIGNEKYWDYLETSAQEHYDYFIKKDAVKANQMLSRSLADCLRGNEGN